MGLLKKPIAGSPTCSNRWLWLLLSLQLLVVVFVLAPSSGKFSQGFSGWLDANLTLPGIGSGDAADVELTNSAGGVELPRQNELSERLSQLNRRPVRNLDLFPSLRDDRVHIVLYVHNRPEFLRLTVEALADVEGINETLLIVSHDGFYEEINAIVESIRFCQVKQIFAPWSPHLFTDAFPGVTPGDCKEKDDAKILGCNGNPDQYGHYRGVRIVSLKHHWWWMMNTVWDGLVETKAFNGHTMFVEEDHYLYPNAYRNIQLLAKLKAEKCPYCIAANLAPLDVIYAGERIEKLVAEKPGNIGYTFNRTVWERIHAQAVPFCTFDDYNWDITMWVSVYPTFGDFYTLRGPRSSARHFGVCGLHKGKTDGCHKSNSKPPVDNADRVPNIDINWSVLKLPMHGYGAGHKGWGGWGDKRDQQLCLNFSSMYAG